VSAHPAPRSDDDTFDLLDDAVAELARRRGMWPGDEHALIHLLASLADQAQRCLPEHVAVARGNHTSWEDIAHLLGTSPHEARLRFDPASPLADGRWPLDSD
jgi:hypothetical protein